MRTYGSQISCQPNVAWQQRTRGNVRPFPEFGTSPAVFEGACERPSPPPTPTSPVLHTQRCTGLLCHTIVPRPTIYAAARCPCGQAIFGRLPSALWRTALPAGAHEDPLAGDRLRKQTGTLAWGEYPPLMRDRSWPAPPLGKCRPL